MGDFHVAFKAFAPASSSLHFHLPDASGMPVRNILSLANKVALITGAAAPLGIGRATAQLFAEHGARVVVTDLVSQRTKGQDAVAEIRRNGGNAIFIALDVSKEEDWVAAIEEWVGRTGRESWGGYIDSERTN